MHYCCLLFLHALLHYCCFYCCLNSDTIYDEATIQAFPGAIVGKCRLIFQAQKLDPTENPPELRYRTSTSNHTISSES